MNILGCIDARGISDFGWGMQTDIEKQPNRLFETGGGLGLVRQNKNVRFSGTILGFWLVWEKI